MPEAKTPAPRITRKTIAAAEKLLGITFTDAERKQMLAGLRQKTDQYQRLRTVQIPNAVPPATGFDPRLPKDRYTAGTPATRSIRLSPQPAIKRPANLEDVAFYPVTHLAELIRTKQVTSVELTEMYLSRLKRFDPMLKCVVTLTDDLAMKQARRADDEIAHGKYRGVLHGIPWGAKDLLAVKGYPTTWGAEPYQKQVIDTDATVVQRLEEAGAVLIAKLTLGALAYGDIWFGGTTKNPWDLSEGSSGSSAGSGATVAAGLVGFAIGTETLGSIVSPSTRCGVTGLRPTFGRISRYGAMALVWSMDKIGPMCRTVEDCAVVFNAIYGSDGLDGDVNDLPFEWNPAAKITDLRVGYVKSAFDQEREGKAIDDQTLDVLRGLGVNLIPIETPAFDLEPVLLILFAEAAAAFDELTRLNWDDQLTWQADEAWPNSFRQARLIPAVEYIQASRVRTQVVQAMAELMQQVDVYVTPSFASSLVMTNLTGNPAVVLPNGFTDKHTPITLESVAGADAAAATPGKPTPTSISFIGRLYREADVLTVAKAYQDATDFHKRYPPMDYPKD